MFRFFARKSPLFLVLEGALILRQHWTLLEPHERRELGRIIGKSRGVPTNLTARERNELRRLVARLDLLTAGRKLMPLRGGVRRSRFGRA